MIMYSYIYAHEAQAIQQTIPLIPLSLLTYINQKIEELANKKTESYILGVLLGTLFLTPKFLGVTI